MKKAHAAANKKTYIAWIWAEPWGDARLCECDCRHSFIHGIYLDGFIRSRGIWKVLPMQEY